MRTCLLINEMIGTYCFPFKTMLKVNDELILRFEIALIWSEQMPTLV